MAGVAGDAHDFPVGELCIDHRGQLDHGPRGDFFRIVVAGVVGNGVAKGTLHAQPCREGPHDESDFGAGLGFQDFQIGGIGQDPLGLFLLRLLGLLVLLILSERQYCERKQQQE
jgi:hypothetical protein